MDDKYFFFLTETDHFEEKTKIVKQQLYHSKRLETNCSLPAARLRRETGWPWLNGKLDTTASNRCLREYVKGIILVRWKCKEKWSALFHGHTSILYAAAHINDATDGMSFSKSWKMKQTNSLFSDIVLKYMTCDESHTHTRILWYCQMGNSLRVEGWVKEDTKCTWSETLCFRGLSGTQGTESRNKSIVMPLVCTENMFPLASLKKCETLAKCLYLNFPAAKTSCSDKISLLFSKGHVSVIRDPLREHNFQHLRIILLH